MVGGLSKLSDREKIVLELAATGLADKEIGRDLSISLNTLRTYWSRIRTKLGEGTRASLVAAYVTRQPRFGHDTSDVPARGWILDLKTEMVLASDEHNRSYGLEPGMPHHRSLYAGGVHPGDISEASRQLESVIVGDVPIVHIVFRTVFPRAVETVHQTLIGIKGEDGQVEKVFGTKVDAHDCRPHPPTGIRTGRWVRHHPNYDFLIDDDLAALLGKPGLKVLTLDELVTFMHAEDVELALRDLDKAIETGTSTLVSNIRLKETGDFQRWARIWREIVTNPDGSVDIYGTLAVFD